MHSPLRTAGHPRVPHAGFTQQAQRTCILQRLDQPVELVSHQAVVNQDLLHCRLKVVGGWVGDKSTIQGPEVLPSPQALGVVHLRMHPSTHPSTHSDCILPPALQAAG